ncbi:hypothetical protein SNE40_004166 [Patella caerulea]|uniref:Uncharacterized protein n=1 Tax=Patella caerulea TaxID=87958 RepID=A0AAN8KIB6_PATCE
MKDQQNLQKLVMKKIEKDEENITSYLKCAYWLGKEEIAKTKFPKLVIDLMRISEDGPEYEDFDFKPALIKWKSMKQRKIFTS